VTCAALLDEALVADMLAQRAQEVSGPMLPSRPGAAHADLDELLSRQIDALYEGMEGERQ